MASSTNPLQMPLHLPLSLQNEDSLKPEQSVQQLNKRSLETELDTFPIEKKQKTEETKHFLYKIIKPNYSHTVYSNSAFVKHIDNPIFIEKLKEFIILYHNRNGFVKTENKPVKICNYSSEFLLLVSYYRVAYYKDTKTNDELWSEFTNISGDIKYNKLF